MFTCERCGSGFSPNRAASTEHCPRCLVHDGVAVPLVFNIFEPGISAPEQATRAAEPTARLAHLVAASQADADPERRPHRGELVPLV